MRCLKAVMAFGVLALALCLTPASVAAPPTNDDFANASVIASLPFSDTATITEATIELGEPIADPGQIGRTVWYSFTPTADAVAQIGPPFSPPSPSPPTFCDLRSHRFLVVYRADSADFAGLVPIAGDQWSTPTVHTLHVEAGTTYYIQGGQTWDLNCGANTFRLSVSVVLPPPNDDFADATPFSSVPFSASPDVTAASIEPGEPTDCGSFDRSVWYAFTPSVTGSYGGDPGVSGVAVYAGSSLADLTKIACSQWWGLGFRAEAGQTYYLQYHDGGMRIDLLPPLSADWCYSPGDPSTFDDVSFSHGCGYWYPQISSYAWDFGDGTESTSPDPSTSHQFAKDGDYQVELTVSADDGRTSSLTRTVQVRTHDITMLSLAAPEKGRLGKPSVVTVGIGNTHHPENVRVDLYKVTSQGDVYVGTSTQPVGVMKIKRAVAFSLSYVFTNEDLALGKVTFKALAEIQGARDAIPTDNAATAPPTLVVR